MHLVTFPRYQRDAIIKKIFKNKGDGVVSTPVAFAHLVNNVQGQQLINANSIFIINDSICSLQHDFTMLYKSISKSIFDSILKGYFSSNFTNVIYQLCQ